MSSRKGILVIHFRTFKIYMLKKNKVVKQKSPKTLSTSSTLKMEMNKNEIDVTTAMDDIRQFT